MRFRQTLVQHILLLLALMLAWEQACFAQSDSGVVRKGRRIDAMPVISGSEESEDSLYSNDEEYQYAEPATAGNSSNDNYLNEEIKKHDFSNEDWSKAIEGLDYSKDRPAPPKERKADREMNDSPGLGSGAGAGLGAGLQVLLFGAVIVVLALLLFLMVGGKYSKNTKVKNDKTFTIEDIEEKIHESDLDRFLREALAKSDFRLAVRIYYLAIIKELSIKELIRWKKDKTNREYLNEVVSRNPELYNDFRDTTLAFEKVWYGDIVITEGDYMNISPRFKKFIESLNRLS